MAADHGRRSRSRRRAAAARPVSLARYDASPVAGRRARASSRCSCIAFLIVPLVRVIVVAFTGPDGGFSLVHFGDFFRTALLREAFWNSIYVAAMTVVLASLIAVPLATILARFRFRGAALIHTLGVVPLVMPPFVGAVAMQLIYGRNGSINLLLIDWFGFRIPFMEGLNGVIFVEALHYFPFILLNLSASLANIDSAMEESAQNLGARGFTLFSRIVFPLALPGYVAGAALVFVKVFDDLATPLLLNVTNMLAPQAYLKITSVGIADPMGYVISVIMIVCSLGAMAAVRAGAARPRLRHPAARRRRARRGAGSAAPAMRSPRRFVVVDAADRRCRRTSASSCCRSRPCGRSRCCPTPSRSQHYVTVYREAGPLIANTHALLRARRADRRRARRDARLCGAAHAAARPPAGRAGRDVGGGDPRPRARHRAAAHLLRRASCRSPASRSRPSGSCW